MKEAKARAPVRANRKAQIVAATEKLLNQHGLSGVTTRAIAQAVPCSEGAIYVHFQDRLALLLAVLQEGLPEMLTPLHALSGKVGKATPARNLGVAITGLLSFHARVTPMLCSLYAEPELLTRFRKSLEAGGKGPHLGIATLARYIEQEQQIGRINSGVDPNTAAIILMAASFFHVFTNGLLGHTQKLNVRKLLDAAIGQ